MSYLTLQEIKDAVEPAGRNGDEFFQTHSRPQFEELLQTFEDESRGVINGQIKGEGYERETDRVDVIDAPDKPHLQLVYPVDSVSKIEIQTIPDNDFTELETELYRADDKKVKLRRTIRRQQDYYFNVQNPLKYQNSRTRWSQICDTVKVTYDRGFETRDIPDEIKSIQKGIIRRMLVHMRQEQNLANLSPDDVQALNTRRILTDDIKDRIRSITQAKNKYTMLR